MTQNTTMATIPEINDLDRLRREYVNRNNQFRNSNHYSDTPVNRFFKDQRAQKTRHLLNKHLSSSISELRILEVGCGQGGKMLEWLQFGASPHKLAGIDLLADRLKKRHSARLKLAQANGLQIPFPANAFDLVLQYTVFTSILDETLKSKIAQEMIRVLRKPNGMIIWYDFWINPLNPQTQGIRREEIRRLFPNCRFEFHKITLAPPLTRYLIRFSEPVCSVLEKLHVFNTHYLVAIRYESTPV